MKQTLRTAICLIWFTLTLQAYAGDIGLSLSYDGLFDNREYKNDMLPQTIYGMRLIPEIELVSGNSRLTGGVSGIWEFGAKSQPKPGVVLYYTHKSENWDALFGSFPRSRLQRQLPDCMLYDSIAFFESCIQGTAFQFSKGTIQAEVYCNWFSRQTQTQREAFRIVSDGFIGSEGQLFSAGWFIAMTHFAKPKEEGHFIYEQFQANPYIQLDLSSRLPDQVGLKTQIGLLADIQRLRIQDYWHVPMGLLANVDASWKDLGFHSTVYSGKALMPFLNDSEAGMVFYRSDPFYNHDFFCKAGLEYSLFKDSSVDLSFCWDFCFTPDTPIHNRQLIKLTCNLEQTLTRFNGK
ncbi:MAG: hypothetical protein MJY58_06820 [Bacteroidaceae bacterium]|nr:hypothetical protein [Bacteroidaceae bacterium]